MHEYFATAGLEYFPLVRQKDDEYLKLFWEIEHAFQLAEDALTPDKKGSMEAGKSIFRKEEAKNRKWRNSDHLQRQWV